MDTTLTGTPLEISDLRSGTDYLAQLALANPMVAERQLMRFLDALLQNPPEPGVLLVLLEQTRAPLCFVEEEMARRSSLKKVSTAAKTELAKYSGKYVLTELLSCGNCGSPYRRVTWTRPEGKKIVWRCINRLENGKKFCKDAPTLEESRIHTAVVSAMNEMFSQKTLKAILQDSIRTALLPENGETSLAAIDSRLSQLREQQYRLLQLAAAVGADSTQYDEELKKVSMEFSALVAKRSELEKNRQDTEQAEERAEQLAAELEAVDTGIATFDEVTVRQLISAITVLSEEKLLIRFKDGTEIEQII